MTKIKKEPNAEFTAFSSSYPLNSIQAKDVKSSRFSFIYSLTWKVSLLVLAALLIIVPLMSFLLSNSVLTVYASFVLLLLSSILVVPFSLLWAFLNNLFVTTNMKNINALQSTSKATSLSLLVMLVIILAMSFLWSLTDPNANNIIYYMLNPFAIAFGVNSIVMSFVSVKKNNAFILQCFKMIGSKN